MEQLQLDLSNIYSFIAEKDMNVHKENALKANTALHEKTGRGNDFLGWVNLPSSINDSLLSELESLRNSLKGSIDYLVVIGIGGSYLGTKAIDAAMSGSIPELVSLKKPKLIYAGHNIGEDYMDELVHFLDNKSYGIVVISKSGTTTEPAIAFRILKEHLEASIGKNNAKDRIIAITDKSKGALRTLANKMGYRSFIIPDDIGGRYSVLTPVGLVPLAIGGFDITKLVQGARQMEQLCGRETGFTDNIAARYATARYALYQSGKKVEILVNYDARLNYVSEWWKQLYGESEGKEGKGIYPASVSFSTDLHSMGQYIQEGERNLFETVVSIENTQKTKLIPVDKDNLDQLNFISGKRIDYINKMAELGTVLAHVDGGVPNIGLKIPQLDEYSLGQLMYFFEKSCGISGYLLGVNPFDQPGVEAYKKNMFALLGKPGFEEETKKIRERLK